MKRGPGRPPKGDRVVGIRPTRDGRQRLRWVLDGKPGSALFPDPVAAQARARAIEEQISTRYAPAGTAAASGPTTTGHPPPAGAPSSQPQTLTLGAGTLADWRGLLWWIALKMVAAPADERWQRLARALAALSDAARKIMVTRDPEATDDDDLDQMSPAELREEFDRLTGQLEVSDAA